jgi:lysophospholipase L1-like esterase
LLDKFSHKGGAYLKLKRFSVLLIVVLALSTLFSSMVSAEKNERHNLVALGDSITFGYNLPDQIGPQPSPHAFPSLIGNGNFHVTNLGVPSLSSTDLLNAVKTNPAFKKALKDADVVTLDIGGIDLLKAAGLTGTTTTLPDFTSLEFQQKLALAEQQLTTNLQAIIKEIKKRTDAPIIIYNMYNPFGVSNDPVFGSLHMAGEQIIKGVNSQVFAPVAFQTGSLLADAYTAFNGNQAKFIIPGDVHPTLVGHQALAKLADQALQKLKCSEKDDHGRHHSNEKEEHRR